MDPGYTLLQHIKTVPNLINEDPSITTPKNSSFMDMPWSEFSKLLNNKRRASASESSTSSESSTDESPENFSLDGLSSTMLFSRLNNLRSANKELDDPLLFYEHSLALHVEMNESIYGLLEVAVLEYKNDARYKNSVRYLRLWLMYILYLDATEFILPILYALIDNHIGDKLAILYQAIAYYHFKSDKLKYVEATLLLGLKNNAEPTKSLERVLYQFRNENMIVFDTNHYTLRQYHIDYHHSLKYPALKSQLDWINVELQHSIRAAILRECCHNRIMSLEELRARSLSQKMRTDGRFDDIKKDLETVFNTIKRKKGLSSRVITTPNKSDNEVNSPLQQTNARLEQTILSHTTTASVVISTVAEQETSNVVQLPHNNGFVQHQINSRGVNKHDNYHTYNTNGPKSNRGSIQLGDNYHVVRKIGQGGMAHVYLVQNTNTLSFYGVKVQQPSHPWEFYVLHQMHKRAQQQKTRLRCLPCFEFHQFMDKSYLIMPYFQNGTLLDALNLYRNKQPPSPSMPEPIVMLFTLQLLQQIDALHSVHIAHNDLKLDNIIMVDKKPTEKPKLPALVMIDFGRSVDLSMFKSCMFKATWPPACALSDYPFINKEYFPIFADYWQLATIVHLLLFGSSMKYALRNGRYCIQNTIKRYWNKALWGIFFETMLNPQKNQDQDFGSLMQEFQARSHDVPKDLILDFKSLLPHHRLG